MNKKGFSMPVILAVIVVPIVLITLAAQINEKLIGGDSQPRKAGLAATAIQSAKQEEIQLLTVISLELKNAAYKAHFDLAEQGGTFQFGECGNIDGTALWNSRSSWTDQRCIPTLPSIKEAYKKYLRFHLGPYLRTLSLPEDTYEFLIHTDGTITAFAIPSIELPLVLKDKAGIAQFKPDTEIQIPFTLTPYIRITQQARDLLSNTFTCQSEDGFFPQQCVKKLIESTPNWKLLKTENDVFFFEATTNQELPREANAMITREPVKVRFAFVIRDILR